METIIFLFISLILLIPILLYIPLLINTRGKLVIVAGAIITTLVIKMGATVYPVWLVAVFVIAIITLASLYLSKKNEWFEKEKTNPLPLKRHSELNASVQKEQEPIFSVTEDLAELEAERSSEDFSSAAISSNITHSSTSEIVKESISKERSIHDGHEEKGKELEDEFAFLDMHASEKIEELEENEQYISMLEDNELEVLDLPSNKISEIEKLEEEANTATWEEISHEEIDIEQVIEEKEENYLLSLPENPNVEEFIEGEMILAGVKDRKLSENEVLLWEGISPEDVSMDGIRIQLDKALENNDVLGDYELKHLKEPKLDFTSEDLQANDLVSSSIEEEIIVNNSEKSDSILPFDIVKNEIDKTFNSSVEAIESRPNMKKTLTRFEKQEQVNQAIQNLNTQYEDVIIMYLNQNLNDNEYFSFAACLLHHYIASGESEKLQRLFNELKDKFSNNKVIIQRLKDMEEQYLREIE